ncbi:hypothetical protein EKL97_02970 [Flavobacterium sp. LS1P28]|uniref:hypothetical protein n=1 Tax=unclassified Flavobacterium TaxID=196869 RepID=UPI000F8490A5|nr:MULTISPECIES: hypothetical protein [unclassified Flavobacterium]RTY83117.1 hypothetical protein EKL99_05950 [Flavobacterium sp. ZB4P23]RTY84248.1 hypothetical protein EKL97_02970 [Flavobacterium sp. LS1P28]RTZ08494.1 hypothetical protein EKM03_02525 [Flavobacterium sp. GSP6]
MKINKRNLSILIITNILFSCSTPSASMKSEMNTFSKEGMITGSFSLENRKTISPVYKINYVQIESETSTNMFADKLNEKKTNFLYNPGQITFGSTNGDFTEDDKNVYLFNIVKTAGKYRIYEIEAFLNTGYMQSTKKIPVDIKFEIMAGKIKYLGEINYNVKENIIKIIDNIERDRLKFQEINPNIKF